MKMCAYCPKCREVDERRSAIRVVGSEAASSLRILDLKELDAADIHSGKLTLRCSQGHETTVPLPVPIHEVLFDLGCFALLDGYEREAVTSFASSFERFMEYGCRFLLVKRQPEDTLIDTWWKAVSSQSERQHGSFLALWAAEFGEPAPSLGQKLQELRNNCVHKGRIPRKEEAEEYGLAVLRAEVGGIVRLRNCFDSDFEFDDFIERYVMRLSEADPLVLGFWENNVISRMWRPNERAELDSDDDEGPLPVEYRKKNPTDPTKLTMERALRVADFQRSHVWTRK